MSTPPSHPRLGADPYRSSDRSMPGSSSFAGSAMTTASSSPHYSHPSRHPFAGPSPVHATPPYHPPTSYPMPYDSHPHSPAAAQPYHHHHSHSQQQQQQQQQHHHHPAPSSSSPAITPSSTNQPDQPYTSHSQPPQQQPPQQQQPQPSSSSSSSQPPPQQQQPHSRDNSGYRPLNVRDALTYLDQVKMEFSDLPNIYNRFLDIMKEFKSQTLDTPGVIERVSMLFHGRPELISGFNTFLPPGYYIQCTTDPSVVRVTAPNGVVSTIHTAPRTAQPAHPPPPPPPPMPPSHHHPPVPHLPPAHHHHPMAASGPPSRPPRSAPGAAQPMPPQYAPPPPHMPGYPYPPSHPLPMTYQEEEEEDEDERDSPMEFNHAITYVNKIKNRFADEPEKYKKFLEVLQTYQKDQRPIQEVYAFVQYLFDGAPDLLEEFKQFLPDITGQPASALDEGPYYRGENANRRMGSPVSSIAPTGRRKRVAQTKKSKMKRTDSATDEDYSEVPYAQPVSAFDTAQPDVSLDEVELFDRIRKYIGNKPSYEEFLKTLNLYTTQVINLDTLIVQVQSFIGNNKDLFEWFKYTVGYDSKDRPIERPRRIIPKPDLHRCQTVADSPSYRLVSEDWQHQPCSARDELCWEVLNDEYVSHPIWASEDSGFAASRKNQYEEAMHRCEEERYEYDLNIQANQNTIALMEPLAKQIEEMSVDEKAAFRLEPGLGGQTRSIYERIIKRVYGKEAGADVIEMLYENPGHAVPTVLKRLKQKGEEWKKAQREWNIVWREMDDKNFYRSLDYQSITFKSTDRKALAPKALTAEIENTRQMQLESLKPNDEEPKYQLQYAFEDVHVFKDVTRIVLSFIERQHAYTNNDRRKVRAFLSTFVPLFFDVEDVLPEGSNHYSDDNEDDDMVEDEEQSTSSETENGGAGGGSESEADKRSESPVIKQQQQQQRRRSRKNRAAKSQQELDLLRDVLTRDTKTGDEENEDAATDETETEAKERPTKRSKQQNARSDEHFADAMADFIPSAQKQKVYNFYCNPTFYCLLRLYQVLYTRLLKMKTLDKALRADARKGKKVNGVAKYLGLYSSRFDDIDVSEGYYSALLNMIDRFFDGEMEQIQFEESVRYLFVTDGYLLFTVDKITQSLVKQIQNVSSDHQSINLLRLFRDNVQRHERMASYRSDALSNINSDENVFLISFNTDTRQMTMLLLSEDEEEDEEDEEGEREEEQEEDVSARSVASEDRNQVAKKEEEEEEEQVVVKEDSTRPDAPPAATEDTTTEQKKETVADEEDVVMEEASKSQ
ncbi:hypothetical protein BCR43DRAFT_507394 [Syncephalastrum racemosum]|uniref:Histone deacetylase interacting domain-containing protein n=1 Tax=Syncephalastrum racemosum TaxID=13706 RepID=A0A1X2H719_SYNRA|nr:hypothetical protein BCR43DRAFT_507394 [Syncephalastrum racemosum]